MILLLFKKTVSTTVSVETYARDDYFIINEYRIALLTSDIRLNPRLLLSTCFYDNRVHYDFISVAPRDRSYIKCIQIMKK